MIGHGYISSIGDGRARVASLDIPGHVTPPLVVPGSIAASAPQPGALVIYAEFGDGSGAVLAVMEE